ncbi:unnamed protein product [Adineta ricciae]|uniref:Uncharacterized protein n=1 Tax=Adineta ricciae TaxID=249248 RepID=A0A815MLJ0_ADIRI|nr:unnamed protein product [Adineta ricciae]
MSSNDATTEESSAHDVEDASSLCRSSGTSPEDELPMSHPQYTSSITTTSSCIITSQLSTSFRTDDASNDYQNCAGMIDLGPYPLRLDIDYLYQIGLKPDEFINYCKMESDKLAFNDPMDVIDHFIQNRLKHGLDMGINEECLIHLTKVGKTFSNEESFEHYVYDYIEVQFPGQHIRCWIRPSDKIRSDSWKRNWIGIRLEKFRRLLQVL